MPVNILDGYEVFPSSPRVLSLFTISFLAFSTCVGKTSVDRNQYAFQKFLPFLISVIHSIVLLIRRRFIVTIDDIIYLMIFIVSFSLYLTYESPGAAENNRFAQPFLHAEKIKKQQ
jgi:hypothetical protein